MHLCHSCCVAVNAVLLGDAGIEAANHDGVRKVAGGEGDAVIPPVYTFDDPFVGKTVRSVTVVTGRHRLVAGVVPAGILVAHDVAIDTGRRVIG